MDSVGANIAESTGRRQPGEKRQHYVIARGSLLEAEHWLERAYARGLLEQPMSDRVEEIARVLNGLVRRPTRASRS